MPRRLISADARISDASTGVVNPISETATASRRLMVPKLLIPPGARIDTPLNAGSPVTATVSTSVFDEAFLGDSFGGHRHTVNEWLISFSIHSGPLHVGGEVKPPRELYKPPPKYPLLAVQARIEGDVQIDALIDKGGNVVQARAISGPGVLIPAALEAVKHWKYQPTYLNGVPWPVELTVHVTFSLS